MKEETPVTVKELFDALVKNNDIELNEVLLNNTVKFSERSVNSKDVFVSTFVDGELILERMVINFDEFSASTIGDSPIIFHLGIGSCLIYSKSVLFGILNSNKEIGIANNKHTENITVKEAFESIMSMLYNYVLK